MSETITDLGNRILYLRDKEAQHRKRLKFYHKKLQKAETPEYKVDLDKKIIKTVSKLSKVGLELEIPIGSYEN